MNVIGATNWTEFKRIINEDAFDTFFQDTIIWRRSLGGIDRFMEDKLTERFTDITLKCLIQYNHFRVWPTNVTTVSGELDRQNVVILLNLKYLLDLGYVNANGNFNYDAAADRFVLDGMILKSAGDTKISQAFDEPLLFQLNLSKEETDTSKSPI